MKRPHPATPEEQPAPAVAGGARLDAVGSGKRPREEEQQAAMAAEQGGSSNSREHVLLLKVLNVPASEAPGPDQLNLANLSQYLEQQVAERSRASPGKAGGLEEGILFLARAWRRSEEGGVVPSTWPGIAPLQEAVLNVSLSSMLAATSEEKLRALTALLEVPVPARLMNDLLVGAAEDDDEVPRRLLLALAGGLRGCHLNDLRTPQVAKLLRVLRASKRYPAVLVSPPCVEEIWQPPFTARFQWKNRKQGQGIALQSKSLLGWLLAPSALDCGFVGPSAAAQGHTEAGTSEWQQLLGSSAGGSALRRASRQRIEQLQRGTQLKVVGAQSSAAEFADVMLRAGDAPRLAVLNWMGTLLTSAEPRGKQGHVAPEGFNFWPQMGHHVVDVLMHQETPPFERSMKNLLLVQALQARIHGFPTSGMSVNSFQLLLHLAKPIKPEQATGLCCYLPLRTDSAELLGSWQKEARFGEEAQVKAAEQLCASGSGSSLFAVPLSDKSLFKTEIFWLACKGLGVLLLPVAKETFQAFSNIASACYDKAERLQRGQDSDAGPGVSSSDFAANSDAAWREVLLAESMIKEPGFLERLGHFVDLTFCFLLHNASPGDGSEPLPPAAPGPRWHALPSVLLENVLELCDLYRDRHPPGRGGAGGGLPTGLYAHIDPKPLLTTLCIVMASDEHVKDPSLRGRAVKLLHRLCMAFPTSWMEQLNQPPLAQHLIPCLVTVFIAVEKAILSYYDLAYRYKYELRLPVMDLFDLALSHPSGLHIKVLHDFAKTKQGTEKLGKLLTQLINDSNSQTEEAIRTVKEYRERQAKEAAAAAGGSGRQQHDEEVLDDDHTEGGEDVYRRSRMNYKEHAKKYFGLASKTWKQLWLLCKHVAPLIVEGSTPVLEQLLHSSLDAQLHVLVGPEMKSIQSRTRGSQQEFEELGFEPNVLMKQIAEIYLFLTRVNMVKVVHIVGKDERYYSSTTFSKAFNFLRKYHLLGQEELKEFDSFVKELAEKVSQQRAAFNEADIPEEFLCQMMADIMSDPVMFPQSKKVVDRSVAERQIMGADKDPYANTPLKVEELISMPELKEKIHRFAKENGIVLEGGNMFD